MNQPSPQSPIYQLRTVLRGINPLIWRRLLVRSDTTLAQLHTILQIVFAWSDELLYSFHMYGRDYGNRGANPDQVLLRDLRLHCGERFRYVYDIGAHWACDIRLEALLPLAPRRIYPVCIGGKRAGPSEDCRGAWAYMVRLEQHRLSPPLEAMHVMAVAISVLLEADPHMSVRETLGFSLAEGKAVLQALQEVVVEWQMDVYRRQQPTCPQCGKTCRRKGMHHKAAQKLHTSVAHIWLSTSVRPSRAAFLRMAAISRARSRSLYSSGLRSRNGVRWVSR